MRVRAHVKKEEEPSSSGDLSPKEVTSLPMFVKITSKIEETSPSFQEFLVKVNQDVLYLIKDSSNSQSNMRAIIDSLNLKQLIRSTDDIANLKCCSRVGPVEKAQKIQVSDSDYSVFCYKITSILADWELCSTDSIDIQEFREDLLQNIIISSGIKQPNIFNPKQSLTDVKNFSWDHQETWSGLCSSGSHQSPIDIVKFQRQPDMSVNFKYTAITVPEEGKNLAKKDQVVVHFDKNQQHIIGNFGVFEHKLGDTVNSYDAKHITISFPSEHSIQGEFFDAELQVYHESSTGEIAIVSFMIKSDDNGSSNLFLKNLSPELWNFDSSKPVELKNELLLQELVPGNLQEFYKKDYFYYVGSESTPPCSEGVARIIMNTPINVLPEELKGIQTKAYDSEANINGNARLLNINDGRQVYFHKDTSNVCEYKVPGETDAEKTAQTEADKEAEEDDDVERQPPLVDGKFYSLNVKLQKPIYIPASSASNMVTGDVGNGIQVKSRDVPATNAEKIKLMKEYYKANPGEEPEDE